MREHIIIDGDIIAFMAALRNPDILEDAKVSADKFIMDIVENCWGDPADVTMFIKGDGNFRMGHADYKQIRTKTVSTRPNTLEPVRQYLGSLPGTTFAHNAEADDYCTAFAQGCLDRGEKYTICTIDKDLRQMPGVHYNIRTCVTDVVTPEQGYDFLLQQTLTGDRVDGIDGLKGIGPVKAQKVLKEATGTRENAIALKYLSVYGDEIVEGGLPRWKFECEKCWNLVYMRRSLDDLKLLPLPEEFML